MLERVCCDIIGSKVLGEMIIKKSRWLGTLLNVSDIEKSKAFYSTVMGMEIISDLPTHVVLGNVTEYDALVPLLGLQYDFPALVAGDGYTTQPTGAKIEMSTKIHNTQIYFEVDDLDNMVAELKSIEGIEILHDIVELSYGPRSMRFYDYDKHIVEVSESFGDAAKRFLAHGFTVEEIAERFGDSVNHVQQLLDDE